MFPGMMPILQPPLPSGDGAMMPGQLGPTRRDLLWRRSAWATCEEAEPDGLYSCFGSSDMLLFIFAATATYSDLVLLGDALGDADNQRDLGLDGLDDGVGRKGRGNIDDGRFRLDLVVGLYVHCGANGQREPRLRDGT